MSLARKKMGQKKSQSLGSDVKCHITLRGGGFDIFHVDTTLRKSGKKIRHAIVGDYKMHTSMGLHINYIKR